MMNSRVKYVIFSRGEMNKHISGVQLFEKGLINALESLGIKEIRIVRPFGKNVPRFLRVLYEQFWIPLHLNFLGRPICISFLNSFPVLYSKNIITLHDVSPLIGDWHKGFRYKLFYNLFLRYHIAVARCVITVSEASAKDIISFYKVPYSKFIVLGNSVSFTENDKLNSMTIFPEPIHRREYILVVGSIDPRKNISSAISIFKKAKLDNIDLVIVGGNNSIFKVGPLEDSKIGQVFFTGYITTEKLINYYRFCRAFVSMSSYEGFGVPILEALYFNKPVLANDIEVYRDIYGDSIFYTNVSDIEGAARALRDLLLNVSPVNKNVDPVVRFTWNKMAHKLVDRL